MSAFQSSVEKVPLSSEQFSVSILWQVIMINGYSVAFEQCALLSPCCSSHGWEVEMVSAYNLDNKADIIYLGYYDIPFSLLLVCGREGEQNLWSETKRQK